MEWELWSSAIACAGNLALALVVLQKGRKDPLGIPLLLLCLITATWNLGALVYGLTDVAAWHILDISVSPWTAPVAFHLAVAFVGQVRKLRWALWVAYLWGAVLSVWPSLYVLVEGTAPKAEVPGAWPVVYLAGIGTFLLVAFGLLGSHLSQQRATRERIRTRLFMGAAVLGAVLGATEIADIFVARLPSLGPVGSVIVVGLLIVSVLRFGLLRGTARVAHILYAVSLAGAFILAAFVVVRIFSSQLAVLLVCLTLITLALVAAVREWSGWATAQQERLRQLAGLGRMSAQMAHDLKNPLAALKGTTQLLEVYLESEDKLLSEVEPSVRRLGEQVGRLERTIARYEGIGRVEPDLEPVQLSALVEEVLSGFDHEQAITFEREIEDVDGLRADAELVRLTIENLVRNAIQAMPDGGELSVRLRELGGHARLEIGDEGVGMSARDAARAMDDFFTTKADGSGLGLAFVRRVVEAHEGTVLIDSTLEVGTTIIIELPLEPT